MSDTQKLQQAADGGCPPATCSLCDGSGTRIIGERDGENFWNRCVPCECQSDPMIPVRASQWAWLNQCARSLADLKERHKNVLEDMEELIDERDEARVIATEACAMLADNGFETNYPPMPWDDSEANE